MQVTVRDTEAPTINAPQDVSVIIKSLDSAPVKLIIGMAGVSDNCLSDVLVMHDAPKDLLFPIGTTIVTWIASDAGGNKTKATQKITVTTSESKATHEPKLEPVPPPGITSVLCDKYAKTAVLQNIQNLERSCGFSGPRWNSEYRHHYQWCIRAQKQKIVEEMKIRSEELQNNCSGYNGRH